MGFIWDLIQHDQISKQQTRTETLEHRVMRLERELDGTRETINELIRRLEKRFGEDINNDGRVG